MRYSKYKLRQIIRKICIEILRIREENKNKIRQLCHTLLTLIYRMGPNEYSRPMSCRIEVALARCNPGAAAQIRSIGNAWHNLYSRRILTYRRALIRTTRFCEGRHATHYM